MAHDVFISYSSKDKIVADAITVNLEKKGIRCWIAPRDILPGRNWGESIIEAIHASKILILVLSSNSNKSPQIVRELERAVDTGIPIIPFRVEEILPSDSISYFIAGAHWLDALTPPLEEHINSLTRTLDILLEPSKSLKDKEIHEIPGDEVYQHENSDFRISEQEIIPKTEQFTYGIIFRVLGVIFGLVYLLSFVGTVGSVEYYFVRELYESGTLFAAEEFIMFIIGGYLIYSSFKSQTVESRFTAKVVILIVIGIVLLVSLISFPHVMFLNE